MQSPTALVGSDPRCQFYLPESVASSKELLFQVVAGKIFCLGLGDSEDQSHRIKRRSLGSAGVEVNGFEIRAFEEKGPDTEVERSLDLGRADGLDETETNAKFEFVKRNEGRQGVVIPISRPVTVMGRSPRCRVSFNSWSASRFHVACIATPTGVWIVDLKSRTGTFVNEVPVGVHRINVGDRLRVGPSRLEFRLATAPVEQAEVVVSQSQKFSPVVSPAVEQTLAASEDQEPSSNSEVLELVASLATVFSRAPTEERSMVDSRSIVRALNDMLRMQSLQLDEIRRLNTYLATNSVTPKALLEFVGQNEGPPRPPPSPIKPSGKIRGVGAEPDVHEWFQEGNAETVEEDRSVASMLKRILRRN